jgi:hypothetical protein
MAIKSPSVLWNIEQDLKTSDKEQARRNIDAAGIRNVEWVAGLPDDVTKWRGKLQFIELSSGTMARITDAEKVEGGNTAPLHRVYLVPDFDESSNTDDGKVLCVENNSLKFADKTIYKGIVTIAYTGTLEDAGGHYIAGGKFNHDNVTGNPNDAPTVTYREQTGKPSKIEFRPKVKFNESDYMCLDYNTRLGNVLNFACIISITSHSGYDLTRQAYWGHDSTMRQMVGSMHRNLSFENNERMLMNGAIFASTVGNAISTTYSVEMIAEYLYEADEEE